MRINIQSELWWAHEPVLPPDASLRLQYNASRYRAGYEPRSRFRRPQLDARPHIRFDKVAAARRAMARGELEDDRKLEIVAQRLLEELQREGAFSL
jgi:hypothetical protein